MNRMLLISAPTKKRNIFFKFLKRKLLKIKIYSTIYCFNPILILQTIRMNQPRPHSFEKYIRLTPALKLTPPDKNKSDAT